MKKLKIVLSQLSCKAGDKESNLKKIEDSIEQAYYLKADILVLPEMFLTGFVPKERMKTLAEPRDGDSLKRVQQVLKKYPMHLVYTFPEYVSDDLIYNTTCFINNQGIPLEFYRKVHLFDSERLIVKRGHEWISVMVDGLKIGLLTCYDIEFPEASRALALRGVNLLLVPSANMMPYEHRHRTFITSRAIENHVFIAYCNIVGKSERYEYLGQSAVVTPLGEVIMDLGDNEEKIEVVEINLDEVVKSKAVFNYIEERIPELY